MSLNAVEGTLRNAGRDRFFAAVEHDLRGFRMTLPGAAATSPGAATRRTM